MSVSQTFLGFFLLSLIPYSPLNKASSDDGWIWNALPTNLYLPMNIYICREEQPKSEDIEKGTFDHVSCYRYQTYKI